MIVLALTPEKVAMAKAAAVTEKVATERVDMARVAMERVDMARVAMERVDMARVAMERVDMARVAMERVDMARAAMAREMMRPIAPMMWVDTVVTITLKTSATNTLLRPTRKPKLLPSQRSKLSRTLRKLRRNKTR